MTHAFWCAGLVLAGLGLAGCSTVPAGRYAGTAVIDSGVCRADARAGQTMPASLILAGGEAQFLPGDGVVVLRGRVDEVGHVVASTAASGAEGRFTQVFDATVTGNEAKGRYASPRCRATVTLTRR